MHIFYRRLRPQNYVALPENTETGRHCHSDVGANLGVVSLAMAKFVGPSGRVHCFEPNPKTQNLLSQSINRSRVRIETSRFTRLRLAPKMQG
jgi:predicted O-methyltransferase YrrM